LVNKAAALPASESSLANVSGEMTLVVGIGRRQDLFCPFNVFLAIFLDFSADPLRIHRRFIIPT
jgi:hypothetical protein